MNYKKSIRNRWVRKVFGEYAAHCAQSGKMPRLEFESGSGPLVIRAETELRGIGAAARRCGVSHTHLRKVLQGERVPSAALARKMKALGLAPGMMQEGK